VYVGQEADADQGQKTTVNAILPLPHAFTGRSFPQPVSSPMGYAFSQLQLGLVHVTVSQPPAPREMLCVKPWILLISYELGV